LLLEVTTSGAWEPWLLYMLSAVQETSEWTTAKIKAIDDLMTSTVRFVSAERPKIYSRELIEIIFTQPYCRIANIVQGGLANRATASKHLKQLADIGVLVERKEGRENLYINARFLDLLISDSNEAAPFNASKT
jgi:Fic family protein